MLKNKVILVTGGAGLLGKTFCDSIASNGAKVIISDLNLDKANEIANSIQNAEAIQLDITSKESILKSIDLIHAKYGHIDALVNNAYPRNKNYGRQFLDVEFEDFSENLSINLGGYFLTSQQFAKYFIKQGHGNIINISSIYGVIPPKFEIYNNTKMTMPVEYAAIKSALIHLTKYMAKYFKGKNIRVNSISPGGILDQQPEAFLHAYKNMSLNKGMLSPNDISGALVFLLSDNSKYINGQNIIVDDGFSL